MTAIRTLRLGAVAGAGALTMLAWPATALPAGHSIDVPLCGGGFVRLDLPSPERRPAPRCDKACHAWCDRKSRTMAADRNKARGKRS